MYANVEELYTLKAESPNFGGSCGLTVVASFGAEHQDYITKKIGCSIFVKVIGDSEEEYAFYPWVPGERGNCGYDVEKAQHTLNQAVMATILEKHGFLVAKEDFYYLEVGINETVNVELANDSVLCYLEDEHRGPYNFYPIGYHEFEKLISWIEVFTRNSV